MKSIEALAEEGRRYFQAVRYVGRFGILGRSPQGVLQQAYGVTARSEPNKQRRIIIKPSDTDPEGGDGNAFVEPIDPAQHTPEELENIQYQATECVSGSHIISNGRHIDDIRAGITIPELSLESVVADLDAERDSLRTARIFGVVDSDGMNSSTIGIIRAQEETAVQTHMHDYDTLPNGAGYCFHTYEDDEDGNPAPFNRLPYLVPILNTPEETAQLYWGMLNPEFRVCLLVKEITGESYRHVVINRF